MLPNSLNVRGLLHCIKSDNFKSSQISNSKIPVFRTIFTYVFLRLFLLLFIIYGFTEPVEYLSSTWQSVKHWFEAFFSPKNFHLVQDNHLHIYLFPGCFNLNQLYEGKTHTFESMVEWILINVCTGITIIRIKR